MHDRYKFLASRIGLMSFELIGCFKEALKLKNYKFFTIIFDLELNLLLVGVPPIYYTLVLQKKTKVNFLAPD